jgi:hypothetical protein
MPKEETQHHKGDVKEVDPSTSSAALAYIRICTETKNI